MLGGYMNNKVDKIIIGVIIALFLVYFYNVEKENNENMYKIEPKAYNVCGKQIYITDFTYGNNLDSEALLNEIEYICKNTK
jgi:hypothetical protein